MYNITKYHLRLQEKKNQWGIESAITFKRRQVLKLYETTGTTSMLCIYVYKYDRAHAYMMVGVFPEEGDGGWMRID